MHTVFRIGEITPMDGNNRLFQVKLTLTSDNDKDLRVLTNHIREETVSRLDWMVSTGSSPTEYGTVGEGPTGVRDPPGADNG